MDQVEELRADVRDGNCIVIVGTGVSSALSGGDPRSSWVGLLRSGLESALQMGSVNPDLYQRLGRVLDAPVDAESLLGIASDLVEALGGPEGRDFAHWLRTDVGYLEVKDPSLAKALVSLRIPILTTNLDDLIEKATGRDHVTWQDASVLQLVISNKSRQIGHLHGYWDQPKSIVLTSEQYQLMLEDRQFEFVRQAMMAVNSIVYVGFGAGLDDPNFTNLRRWMIDLFPATQIRHYRLCLDDEWEALVAQHRDENIYPVRYGSSHSDMTNFLTGIAPHQREVVPRGPDTWFQIIEEHAREGAILAPHVRGADEARITELMIPPVLLTVTQEQFIAATRGEGQTRPSRCDPHDDARESRLLIAGDEHVGVSSALMWIGVQKCLADSQLIPIVIDYIALGSSGTNPLRRQVIKELRKTGQWLREHDDLPPVVLIIDNMHLGARPRLDRVISELCSGSYAHILIGCRVGVEGKLYDQVSKACGKFERRYVGRLARDDVRALARLVDAPREESLSNKAIEVVRAHSLPSTPFTYSMILSAILRGESLMAATSPTSLLDAYLDLLLGRGGISEDSRFGLDAINRGYILGELAELFVRRQAGALPQMQVVGRLEESFETLDWPEVPVDIIKDLQRRHILVLRGGEVSFTQSSYLHLFAAKRALESPEFLDHLVADALYYAPILAHYAALKRSDVKLLARLMSLIDPFLDETVVRSSAFREADVKAKADSSVEEIGRSIDREAALATRDGPSEDDFTPLDAMEDDLVPFPLTPIDDQPPIARMVTGLGLLSNVLRDTEIFPDHEVRKHALRRILDGWAQFADRIEAEENFGPMVRLITEHLAHELKLSPKRIKRMADEIATILPLSMALGGISATLSTRKLSRTVERCFDDEEFCTDPALAVLGAYMLCDIQTVGWSRPLPMIYESHGKILGIRTLFRKVLMFTYFRIPLEAQDERILQEFLTEQLIDDEMPRSKKERSALRGQVIERLKRAKLNWKDAKLPAGQSPMLSAGTVEDGES